MRTSLKLSLLLASLVAIIALFLLFEIDLSQDYMIHKRSIRLASMLVVGVSVGFSSLVFQTLSQNRILTPAIMGYESIFILFQTVIVFIYGDKTFQVITEQNNFFYAVLLMMGFSLLMYLFMFRRSKLGMLYLLLSGIVMDTLFQTFIQFMQILIDPNEFTVIQNFMFVSFSKMNTKLLSIASITLVATLIYASFYIKYLDVIALGRDHAINLGLNYQGLVRRFMLVISLLVSVSTALVGPITFLGILVCNLTYELFPNRKHPAMLTVCCLISCLCLVAGQFLIEHIFQFSTTVSIVINFIGGLYFLYLLWSTRKKIT